MWDNNIELYIKCLTACIICYVTTIVLGFIFLLSGLPISYSIQELLNVATGLYLSVLIFFALLCYWELTYFREWESHPIGIIDIS